MDECKNLEEGTYKCAYCNFSSPKSAGSVRQHSRYMHSNLNTKVLKVVNGELVEVDLKYNPNAVEKSLHKFKCYHCDYSSNGASAVRKHCKKNHLRKPNLILKLQDGNFVEWRSKFDKLPFRCAHCQLSSNKAGNLVIHSKQHHPDLEVKLLYFQNGEALNWQPRIRPSRSKKYSSESESPRSNDQSIDYTNRLRIRNQSITQALSDLNQLLESPITNQQSIAQAPCGLNQQSESPITNEQSIAQAPCDLQSEPPIKNEQSIAQAPCDLNHQSESPTTNQQSILKQHLESPITNKQSTVKAPGGLDQQTDILETNQQSIEHDSNQQNLDDQFKANLRDRLLKLLPI